MPWKKIEYNQHDEIKQHKTFHSIVHIIIR